MSSTFQFLQLLPLIIDSLKDPTDLAFVSSRLRTLSKELLAGLSLRGSDDLSSDPDHKDLEKGFVLISGAKHKASDIFLASVRSFALFSGASLAHAATAIFTAEARKSEFGGNISRASLELFFADRVSLLSSLRHIFIGTSDSHVHPDTQSVYQGYLDELLGSKISVDSLVATLFEHLANIDLKIKRLNDTQSLLHKALLAHHATEDDITFTSKQWRNERTEVAFLISTLFLYSNVTLDTLEHLITRCRSCAKDDHLIPYFVTTLCTKFCDYGTQHEHLVSSKPTLDRFKALLEGNWTCLSFKNAVVVIWFVYFKLNRDYLSGLNLGIDFAVIAKQCQDAIQAGALQYLTKISVTVLGFNQQPNELVQLFMDVLPNTKLLLIHASEDAIQTTSTDNKTGPTYGDMAQYYTPIVGGMVITLIKSNIEFIKLLRNIEEDADSIEHSKAAVVADTPCETLMVLVAVLFGQEDHGSEFWSSTDLKPFLRLCWETRSPKLLKTFILMLSALSTGSLCAGFAHEYLMSDGKVSYSMLLSSMDTITKSLQSNPGSIIDPTQESSLVAFLFLFETVVKHCNDAKLILVEHHNFRALDVVTALLISPISLRVKSSLFKCLDAFSQSLDQELSLLIIPRVFSFIDASRMLQSEDLMQGGLAYDLHALEAGMCMYTATLSFLSLLNTQVNNPHFLDALFQNKREDLLIVYTQFVVDKVLLSMVERVFVDVNEKYRMIGSAFEIVLASLKQFKALLEVSVENATTPFAQFVIGLVSNAPLFAVFLSIYSEEARELNGKENGWSIHATRLSLQILLTSLNLSRMLSSITSIAFTHTANNIVSNQNVIVEIASLINLASSYEIQELSVEVLLALVSTQQFSVSNYSALHDVSISRLANILFTSVKSEQIIFGFGHALADLSKDRHGLVSKIISLIVAGSDSNFAITSVGYFLLGYDITSEFQSATRNVLDRPSKSALSVIFDDLLVKKRFQRDELISPESVYVYVSFLRIIFILCSEQNTFAGIVNELKSGDRLLMTSQLLYINHFKLQNDNALCDIRNAVYAAEAESLILKIIGLELHNAITRGQSSYANDVIASLTEEAQTSIQSNQSHNILMEILSKLDLSIESSGNLHVSNALSIQPDAALIDGYPVALFDIELIRESVEAADFTQIDNQDSITSLVETFILHNNTQRYKAATYSTVKSWNALVSLIFSTADSHITATPSITRSAMLSAILEQLTTASCEYSVDALSEAVFYLSRRVESNSQPFDATNILFTICNNLLEIIGSSIISQASKCNFALSLEHLIAQSADSSVFIGKHVHALVEVYINILPQSNDVGRILALNLITRILQTVTESQRVSLSRFMQERSIIGFLVTFLSSVDSLLEETTEADVSIEYIYESLLLLLLEIASDACGSHLLLNTLCLDSFSANSLFDRVQDVQSVARLRLVSVVMRIWDTIVTNVGKGNSICSAKLNRFLAARESFFTSIVSAAYNSLDPSLLDLIRFFVRFVSYENSESSPLYRLVADKSFSRLVLKLAKSASTVSNIASIDILLALLQEFNTFDSRKDPKIDAFVTEINLAALSTATASSVEHSLVSIKKDQVLVDTQIDFIETMILLMNDEERITVRPQIKALMQSDIYTGLFGTSREFLRAVYRKGLPYNLFLTYTDTIRSMKRDHALKESSKVEIDISPTREDRMAEVATLKKTISFDNEQLVVKRQLTNMLLNRVGSQAIAIEVADVKQ